MEKNIYKVQRLSTSEKFFVIADNLTEVVAIYPDAYILETVKLGVEVIEVINNPAHDINVRSIK